MDDWTLPAILENKTSSNRAGLTSDSPPCWSVPRPWNRDTPPLVGLSGVQQPENLRHDLSHGQTVSLNSVIRRRRLSDKVAMLKFVSGIKREPFAPDCRTRSEFHR